MEQRLEMAKNQFVQGICSSSIQLSLIKEKPKQLEREDLSLPRPRKPLKLPRSIWMRPRQLPFSPWKTQKQIALPTHFRWPNRPSRNYPSMLHSARTQLLVWLCLGVCPTKPNWGAWLSNREGEDWSVGNAGSMDTYRETACSGNTQRIKHMWGRNGVVISRRHINSRPKYFPRYWIVLLQEHLSWLMGTLEHNLQKCWWILAQQ